MARDENGKPVRAHLEQVELQTGQIVDALHPEPPPDEVAYLWEWFTELNATRPGGFGPGAITFAEIDAWSRLTGIVPTPWEVEVIRRLDRAFIAFSSKTKPKPAPPPKPPSAKRR